MLSKANEIHENKIVVSQYDRTSTHGLIAKVNSMAVIDYIEAILGAQSNGYAIKKESFLQPLLVLHKNACVSW